MLKLTPAPPASSPSEAPNRNIKTQSGPDSQCSSPDWQYFGGVRFLGIPDDIRNSASFPKIDPVTHKELSEPTGRTMTPVLQPGIVSNPKMDEKLALATLYRLEANGWKQFNYTVIAPDGTRYFKLNHSGLESVQMKVVESRWLKGENETSFGQKLTPLMTMVQTINNFDQRPKEANNFVFSDKPTKDFFLSTEKGAQSTLININIKDMITEVALSKVADAVLERHLAIMGILVPTSWDLRERLGKNNLSGVDMADFLTERKATLESAKAGDKDAYKALHQEEVERLKAVQQIFGVMEAKDPAMAAACFTSARAAMDNARPYEGAEPNFERAATSRLTSRGIKEPT